MWLINIIGVKFTVLLRLLGYRKQVIDKNLKNAYPEKDNKTRREIKSQFYIYFGQLLAESIKLFHLSKKELKKDMYLKMILL